MKTEVLNAILRNIYKLTQTPIVVFRNKEKINEYHSQNYFFMKAYCDAALDTDDICNLICTKQSLAMGMIQVDDMHIVFGPVKTVNLNNAMLREIILENDFNLEDVNDLRRMFDFIPTMQIEYFALLVASYYTEINHVILTAEEVLDKLQFETKELKFDSELLVRQGQIVFGSKMPHNTYEYEQKMLYCVKNGLVEDLHKLGYLTTDQYVDVVATDTLRHYKNMIMAQKTLISRASIEGGVDPETAYSLSDIYSHKIENCHTLNEISELSYSMRNTFCKMVRDIKCPKSNDLIINKAIDYVHENITEKITVNEIAEYLGISREYLSSKFKKTMGQPLPEYITEQKIEIAKKLLLFSNKPLIEIANYLSFSSQSYFQIQFKNVTGVTPLKYRNTKE